MKLLPTYTTVPAPTRMLFYMTNWTKQGEKQMPCAVCTHCTTSALCWGDYDWTGASRIRSNPVKVGRGVTSEKFTLIAHLCLRCYTGVSAPTRAVLQTSHSVTEVDEVVLAGCFNMVCQLHPHLWEPT